MTIIRNGNTMFEPRNDDIHDDDEFDTVTGEVIHVTDSAALLDVKGHGEKWIPLSLFYSFDEDSDEHEVKTWFVNKEGL